MAAAISAGLDRQGTIPYARQAASALDADRLNALALKKGFTAMANNRMVRDSAAIVVVAVKPHQVKGVLTELSPNPQANPLYVSIAAGVTLADLRSYLPRGAAIVRVLPNLPALVGKGVTLICAPPETEAADVAKVKTIFDSVGLTVALAESQFDAGTSVSGSGPAYFFLAMEAMIRGAGRLGLPWGTAKDLVLGVALGAAETALASPNLSLAELRDQVTSPGGTTAEALYVLEEGAINALFQKALLAAAEKAKKLA